VSVARLFELGGALDSARAAVGTDTTAAARDVLAQIIARQGNAAAIEQLIARSREEALLP